MLTHCMMHPCRAKDNKKDGFGRAKSAGAAASKAGAKWLETTKASRDSRDVSFMFAVWCKSSKCSCMHKHNWTPERRIASKLY